MIIHSAPLRPKKPSWGRRLGIFWGVNGVKHGHRTTVTDDHDAGMRCPHPGVRGELEKRIGVLAYHQRRRADDISQRHEDDDDVPG